MLEDDLYNEMILLTGKTCSEQVEEVKESKKEKFSVYLSNFTWWTTDQELHDLVAGVGVTDLTDIKIHSNPSNGLSKGYATVTVESAVSVRLMMMKLQDKIIHNRKILVEEFILANLQKHENAFNELVLKQTGSNSIKSTNDIMPMVTTSVLSLPQTSYPLPPPPPPLPMLIVASYPIKPPIVRIPPLHIPAAILPTEIPNKIPHAPVCINHPPQPINPPLNPPLQKIQAFCPNKKMLTKEEFEEIFNLNRTVVERSLERATQDSEAGLFPEAIETLVTAISLIKESRLGSDPQGVALMNPLKKLLQSIEEESLKKDTSKSKTLHPKDQGLSNKMGFLDRLRKDSRRERSIHGSPSSRRFSDRKECWRPERKSRNYDSEKFDDHHDRKYRRKS